MRRTAARSVSVLSLKRPGRRPGHSSAGMYKPIGQWTCTNPLPHSDPGPSPARLARLRVVIVRRAGCRVLHRGPGGRRDGDLRDGGRGPSPELAEEAPRVRDAEVPRRDVFHPRADLSRCCYVWEAQETALRPTHGVDAAPAGVAGRRRVRRGRDVDGARVEEAAPVGLAAAEVIPARGRSASCVAASPRRANRKSGRSAAYGEDTTRSEAAAGASLAVSRAFSKVVVEAFSKRHGSVAQPPRALA